MLIRLRIFYDGIVYDKFSNEVCTELDQYFVDYGELCIRKNPNDENSIRQSYTENVKGIPTQVNQYVSRIELFKELEPKYPNLSFYLRNTVGVTDRHFYIESTFSILK